jgi:hypothetical protein
MFQDSVPNDYTKSIDVKALADLLYVNVLSPAERDSSRSGDAGNYPLTMNGMMAGRGLVAASLPRTEARIPITGSFKAAIG